MAIQYRDTLTVARLDRGLPQREHVHHNIRREEHRRGLLDLEPQDGDQLAAEIR